MKKQPPVVLVLLVLVCMCSISALHYVLPDGSSPLNCPAQPCLTLDQYAQHTGTYFTTGATFLFLAGNHSLQAAVTLANISDVTLRGEGNDSQTTTITCRNGISFQCVTNLTIENLTFVISYSDDTIEAALSFISSENVKMSDCIFQGNKDLHNNTGRAITLLTSSVEILSCVFSNIATTEFLGGAVDATNANVIISLSKFIGNAALLGGAINAENTKLILRRNHFIGNRATGILHFGGAVYVQNTSLTVGGCKFVGNRALSGGAIHIRDKGQLTLEDNLGNVFVHNSGGAIYCHNCHIFSETRNCTFQENSRDYDASEADLVPCLTYFHNNTGTNGGAIELDGVRSFLSINGTNSVFTDNEANGHGGALYLYSAECNFQLSGSNILFEGNKAEIDGGAIYLYFCRTSLDGTNLEFRSNTALRDGGALGISYSELLITAKSAKFISNRATRYGGAATAFSEDEVPLSLNGRDILFSHNTADRDGGALYATGTGITLSNRVNFTSNTAQNGGAMFISATASLTLNHHTTLTTSLNHASLYGGAIYHEDKPTISYVCNHPDDRIDENHPACFLMLGEFKAIHINSHFDSADRDGSFLYGGLLDRCRLSIDGTYNYSITPYNLLTREVFHIESNSNNTAKAITSEPYTLCFCDSHNMSCNATAKSISRGQKFTLSVKAIAQGPVSLQLTALTGSNARIHLNQATQTISKNCTKLEYNFYSSQDHDELRLTTRASCGDVQAVVEVTLLPCPHPFVHINEECACDQRLLEYPNVKCTIDEYNNSFVTKEHGTDFWMGVEYDTNGSYEGLILYKTCPPQYCKTQTVAVSLDDLDSQCDDNRGGVLCGQCLANYSLMLGSSKCRSCSHKYLVLLLPFAVAGIALVVFLSFLRLTVATGMINSVILYANILQANKNFIFPVDDRNVLTVFIAWMNLDLGIETCFYDGLTAYAQTWLQFAFPLYVWILISFIILSSRYSLTVSKLIGHNPIAVLATLLLMSYTKLLKIIIEVYSSVDLDFPENQTDVWLKDANVPYLESWHLLLTVVTTLVLVLFFLPYTLLLLLGYKLYRFSGRKYFRWFDRIRPLLESYYAPYNIHTRYWTGFLLLVRCALYIIFSIYSLENTNKSLLATILTFSVLLVLLLLLLLCFSHKLYTKLHNNILEILAYLNLLVISAATLAGANPPALVYSLVGLVFVAMLGIIVYQFHLLYIAKSQVWQQFKVKVSTLKEKLTRSVARTAAEPPVDIGKSSHEPPKVVNYSELREPLL